MLVTKYECDCIKIWNESNHTKFYSLKKTALPSLFPTMIYYINEIMKLITCNAQKVK